MNRRGFLQAILAAGVAPYVSTAAGVLMPVRQRALWLWGDGIHDDTAALQALFDGKFVKNVGPAIAGTSEEGIFLSSGRFLVTSTIMLPPNESATITQCFFNAPALKGSALFEKTAIENGNIGHPKVTFNNIAFK